MTNTTKRRALNLTIALATSLALITAGAGAADASTGYPSQPSDPIAATEPASAPASVDDDANLARLHQLAHTQTSAEIAGVVGSGKKYYSLLGDPDPKTGRSEVIAAFLAPTTFSFFAISVRSPGCATTEGCAASNSGVNRR